MHQQVIVYQMMRSAKLCECQSLKIKYTVFYHYFGLKWKKYHTVGTIPKSKYRNRIKRQNQVLVKSELTKGRP